MVYFFRNLGRSDGRDYPGALSKLNTVKQRTNNCQATHRARWKSRRKPLKSLKTAMEICTSSRSFPLSTFATHCSSLMRSSWMGVLLGTDAQEVGGFFLDVCRPCGDCEGEVGREGGRDGVFGDGGEVVKQGVEAVDGETIVGSAGGLLG